MELFLHKKGFDGPQLVDVGEDITVTEFLSLHGAPESSAWLENDDELIADEKLSSVGVVEHSHIHVGRCREVAVRVRYGGESKEERFRPSATVQRVFDWAAGPTGFNLDPTERAKHALFLKKVELDPDEHIGVLASDECELTLDLAPKERHEG